MEGIRYAGGGVLASLVFIAAYGSEIGEVSRVRETTITPQNVAFGIWGVIYVFIVSSLISQFASLKKGDASLVRSQLSNIALGVSFLASGLWIPVFTSNTRISTILSSLLLAIALVSGLTSVLTDIAHESKKYVFSQSPVSFYLGWVSVAFTISVFIALKEFQKKDLAFAWAFLPVCVMICFSLPLRDPALLLPLLWAFALSKDPPQLERGYILLLLGVAELVCVFLRFSLRFPASSLGCS